MITKLRLASDRYRLLTQVSSSNANDIVIGRAGTCRYCNRSGAKLFHTQAHAFPEALGASRVYSADECDECNNMFSRYESALAAGIGPFLTFDGVKGKTNKVRQTGRTAGPSYVRSGKDSGQRYIAAILRDQTLHLTSDPLTGSIKHVIPIAAERFRPRHAYKALCKIAFSLLPPDELSNFNSLRAWLIDPDDAVDFPVLEVALSFAGVGFPLTCVTGTLLRRVEDTDGIPYILFILTAGSVCLQIDLPSDHKEDHISCLEIGAIRIRWTTTVTGDNESNSHRCYSEPVYLNWSSTSVEIQPVEAMSLVFVNGHRAP